VSREHDRLALRDLGLLVHEDGTALTELLHDVLVVDDLLANVDGRAVQLERRPSRLRLAIHNPRRSS
jgi:hypothetical protein